MASIEFLLFFCTIAVGTTVFPTVSATLIFNATFTDGFNGFVNVPGNDKDWRRITKYNGGDTGASASLPDRPNENGNYFLAMRMINKLPDEVTGEALSPEVQGSGATIIDYCLRFWINMDSNDKSTLRVMLRMMPDDLDDELLLRQFQGGIPDCTEEYTDFAATGNFKIGLHVYTAPRHLINQKPLCLDDIILSTGKCFPDLQELAAGGSCDFEEGECGFEASLPNENTVSWVRTNRDLMPSGDPQLVDLTPSQDSSYHSAEGHFAFVHFGPKMDDVESQQTTVYRSRPLNLTDPHCISFFFRNQQIPNAPGVEFRVRLQNQHYNKTLFQSAADHGKRWLTVKRPTTLLNPGVYTLTFEASGEPHARAGVAVDDITVAEGICNFPGDCSFNAIDGMCGWQNDDDTAGSMRWANGMVPGGPVATDNYMFIEGGRASGNVINSRALMFSEDFTQLEDVQKENFVPHCITFSYFMNASGAAIVRVHQLSISAVAQARYNRVIWEHRGRNLPLDSTATAEGNVWRLGKAPLMRYESTYVITFEATILRETDASYIMAIDDVQFLMQTEEEFCKVEPAASEPREVVTPPLGTGETVCTFDSPPPADILCDWTLSTGNGPTWNLVTGITDPDDPVHPKFDHTTLEDYGHFLYFKTSAQPGTRAQAVSQVFTRAEVGEPRCMRFWYLYRGPHETRLDVWISQNGTHLNDLISLWMLYPMAPTKQWTLATATIPPNLMSFSLVFEASLTVLQPAASGGIAVDDVSVAHQECREVDCDFEHGSCNWENFYNDQSDDDLDWEFANDTLTPSLFWLGRQGYFMHVAMRTSTPPGHVGFLHHTRNIEGGEMYCLQFDYAVTGKDVGTLAVYYYYINAQTGQWEYPIVWKSDGGPDHGSWYTGQVLFETKQVWSVIFEAQKNPLGVDPAIGDQAVAIDNIRHTVVSDANNCKPIPASAVRPTQAPATTERPNNLHYLDCDFDKGDFCDWKPVKPDYEWKIGKAGDTGNIAGPINGDYSENRSGYFAYIDAPSGQPGEKARLHSEFIAQGGQFCVRFFYNANGIGLGKINLYYVTNEEPLGNHTAPVSVAGRNYGDQWIGVSYQVDTGFTQDREWVIEAERGSSPTSYLAIDRISFKHDRPCDPLGYCNFDDDFCLFNPAINYPEVWRLESLTNDPDFPDQQATAKRITEDGTVFIMNSEIIQPIAKGCLRWEYVLLISQGLSLLNVWTIQYPPGDAVLPVRTAIWTAAEIGSSQLFNRTALLDARAPVSAEYPFQFSVEAVFDALMGLDQERILVDNFQLITTGLCSHFPQIAQPLHWENSTAVPSTVAPNVIYVPDPNLRAYSCSFDDNTFCGWKSNTTAMQFTFLWALTSGQANFGDAGPDSGVNGQGTYAFLQTMPGRTGLGARLESSAITYPATPSSPQPEHYTLGFWYMMHGTHIKNLDVRMRTESDTFDSNSSLLWRTSDNQGKIWKEAHVTIPVTAGQPIWLAIDATRISPSNGNRAQIAVDELLFEMVSDKFDGHVCDFDTSAICGYTFDSDGRIDWTWRNGLDTLDLADDGPLVDKSQNAPRGYYMAFAAGAIMTPEFAHLTSPAQSPTPTACIKFYYYKRHQNSHFRPRTLFVSVIRNVTESEPLWDDVEVIFGDFWSPVFIEIRSPSDQWKVRFTGQVMGVEQPTVAIDHVVLPTGYCPPNPIFCDFDEEQQSMCEWTNDLQTDHIDWVVTVGPTLPDGSGPSGDQSNNADGGYLVFQLPVYENPETARIISPPQKGDSQFVCFTFWYHMYGVVRGQLTVMRRLLATGEETPVWQLSGNQGNQWHAARASFFIPSSSAYQIVIEGKGASNSLPEGKIGIDILNDNWDSSCRTSPSQAVYRPPPTAAPTSGNATMTVPPAPMLFCDFEQGNLCGWTLEQGPSYLWSSEQGGVMSMMIGGPYYDHTIGQVDQADKIGRYLLSLTPNGTNHFNKTARFKSPLVSFDTQPRCLRFWYHIFGPDIGYLKVIRLLGNSDGWQAEHLIWSRFSADEGKVWQLGQADVFLDGPQNHVIFEVVGGKGPGDIALDDISADYGLCHANDSFCDFERGRCNFEDVTDSGEAVMAWQHVQATSDMAMLGVPSVDVTTGTSRGFVLMAQRVATSGASKALTRSPQYKSEPFARCFQFHYNIELVYRNVTDDYFMVTLQPLDGEPKVMLTTAGAYASRSWHLYNFQIPSDTRFTVQFEAQLTIGTGISIDDVSLTDGPCRHPLDCEFDQDSYCLWVNSQNPVQDNFDWGLSEGETDLSGPEHDHSLAPGSAMALANKANLVGSSSRAWLMSPEYPKENYLCLKFWYFIGAKSGNISDFGDYQLRAFGFDPDDDQEATYWVLNDISAPQKGHWLLGWFGRTKFWAEQMVFEARLDQGHYIAVDDISANGTPCDVHPSQADPAFEPAAGNVLFCDFEDFTTCGWNASQVNPQWVMEPAFLSGQMDNGPDHDHTFPPGSQTNGHYMILRMGSEDGNKKARLTSPPLPVVQRKACFKFWYHVFGANVGTLSVGQRVRTKDSFEENVLWTRTEPADGRVWQIGQVDFTVDYADGNLFFEVLTGTDGDWTIDDISATSGLCHPNDNFCDFQNTGTCNFLSQSTSDHLAWYLVVVGNTEHLAGFPDTDVSVGTHAGQYFIAHRFPDATLSRAFTTTAIHKASPVERCYQFFYKIVLAQEGALDYLLVTLAVKPARTNWTSSTVFNTSGVFGSEHWHVFNFPIPPNVDFTVDFEAELSVDSGIAIDDVSVMPGQCRNALDCEFEQDNLCAWNENPPVGSKERKWEVVEGLGTSPSSELVGPPQDHTTGTAAGSMALASLPEKEGALNNVIFSLRSRPVPGRHYMCLSFWYYIGSRQSVLRGESSATYRLRSYGFDKREQFATTYWSLDQSTVPKEGQWLQGQFGRAQNWPEQMVFEAALILKADRYFMAVDDLIVTGSRCKVQPPRAAPDYNPSATTTSWPPTEFGFNCTFSNNFEDDFCVFQNSPSTSPGCRWSLRNGPAVPPNISPQSDHTEQNRDGAYLYFNSDTCKTSAVPIGTLESKYPVGQPQNDDMTSGRQCLIFWYHMYGAPTELSVSVNFRGNKIIRTEFVRKGNQGNRWIQAHVTIDNIDQQPYYLEFEAWPSRSIYGDIALDDISFRDGSCKERENSCDFEEPNYCGYNVLPRFVSLAQFSWNRLKLVDSQEPLPDIDHTFLSHEGHAMFANGTRGNKGDRTFLISLMQIRFPTTDTYDQCLTFWYQLPAQSNGGTLNVHFVLNTNGTLTADDFSDPQWTVTAGKSTAWEYASVTVSPRQPYKFAIEAVNDVESQFLLDDVTVLNKACPTPLSCDFEDGMCGWINEVTDNFDWIIFQGATSSGESAGPTVDHTTNSARGHYLYIDNDFAQGAYDTAHLTSQRIFSQPQLAGRKWCFSFWYHMYIDANSNASLSLVMLDMEQTEKEIWLANQPERNIWLNRLIPLDVPLSLGDFRLSFRGKVNGQRGKSDIALDDLRGQTNPCDKEGGFIYCPTGGKYIRTDQVCDQVENCPNGADESECGTCNFQDPTSQCGYKIFKNDNFTWAPVAPQGSAKGYLTADFSKGTVRSFTYFDSPWLHETSSTCKLEFWYHIGWSVPGNTDPGALYVILQLEDTETTLGIYDVTNIHNDTNLAWQPTYIDIGRFSGEFRIVFRARKGVWNDGYIAITDIQMHDCEFPKEVTGTCQAGMWKCPKTRACIGEDLRCDFTDDCGQNDDEMGCDVEHQSRCDFETDLCHWSNHHETKARWVQTNGRAVTPHSGPLRDHTTGLKNGGYAYLSSSPDPLDIGLTASLVGPTMEPHTAADDCRIRFYYHMYGTTMGNLTLNIAGNTASAPTTTIFSMGGMNLADTWHRESLPLVSDTSATVIFVGSVGGKSSDIALDDITFSQGCKLGGSAGDPTASASTSNPTTNSPSTAPQTARPTVELPTTPPPSPPAATVPQSPATEIVPTSFASSTVDASTRKIEDVIPTNPSGMGRPNGLGAGPIAGIVVSVLSALALAGVVLVIVVRRRRRGGDSQAGSGWFTSGYKNFGTLDGVTTSETDDTDGHGGNSHVMKDFFSRAD
ncbi:MAM and LDL-receptor class A domain-containing protein 2 [Hypsibius exemplaris]|uniref:MAM and LDL-receptor class A domain-containing protein 2 n=1 Tax=Hypsibius exemplaris TaxID=2072580 RepID=A0A1W0W9R2_HYPEX|nr:MAM and LDL-receptor class A domain-containing protein 2 [Hypsibius exemplaris]